MAAIMTLFAGNDAVSRENFNSRLAAANEAFAEQAAASGALGAALDAHRGDGVAHITGAERQSWNNKAVAGHKHSTTDLTSGSLPPERGGTGQASLQAARNAMGLGNTTGVLPVANGGTGALNAAGARANLGVTPANIGAATSEQGTKADNALARSGGELGGKATACANADNTPQLRNIEAGTADLTAGVSALSTGSLYLLYEMN